MQTIRQAVADECRARVRYWIGGVPTEGDLRGVRRIVAHRLRVTEADVTAALAEVDA
ncbi:MAG: hypothetical protein KF887_06995 [Paracoccaceae bacterium]|nr:MAG: hypothetical protein KF887_06995 [Paracoccaceae bacterium]